MLKLKSKTLTKYYGETVSDYNIKFIHYNIELDNTSEEELRLLEQDLDQIYAYAQDDFKIYFSNLGNLKVIKEQTTIIDKYQDNIYVRINNKLEYDNYKELNINVKLLTNLSDLGAIGFNNEEIVLQIDNISELSLDKLDILKDKYNIAKISLGQIPYFNEYFSYLLDEEYKDYHQELAYEKNICLTNDIYDTEEYKRVVLEIQKIIDKCQSDCNINTFRNIFNYLAEIIYYDNDGVLSTKSANQNLVGPLFHKKSVCEGYSKLLYQICSLLNIKCIIVSGGGAKDEGGHIWNQVCIDDIWYNADLTVHSYAIHNNENWNMFLVADKWLRYKSTSYFSKKCDQDYQASIIKR